MAQLSSLLCSVPTLLKDDEPPAIFDCVKPFSFSNWQSTRSMSVIGSWDHNRPTQIRHCEFWLLHPHKLTLKRNWFCLIILANCCLYIGLGHFSWEVDFAHESWTPADMPHLFYQINLGLLACTSTQHNTIL